jgi:hypothetical protein
VETYTIDAPTDGSTLLLSFWNYTTTSDDGGIPFLERGVTFVNGTDVMPSGTVADWMAQSWANEWDTGSPPQWQTNVYNTLVDVVDSALPIVMGVDAKTVASAIYAATSISVMAIPFYLAQLMKMTAMTVEPRPRKLPSAEFCARVKSAAEPILRAAKPRFDIGYTIRHGVLAFRERKLPTYHQPVDRVNSLLAQVHGDEKIDEKKEDPEGETPDIEDAVLLTPVPLSRSKPSSASASSSASAGAGSLPMQDFGPKVRVSVSPARK